MPSVDVKWPSEDEEFDTKTVNSDAQSVATATAEPTAQAAPAAEEAPVAQAAPATTEAPAEEAASPSATEATSEEPATTNVSTPTVTGGTPDTPVTATTARSNGNLWRLVLEAVLVIAVIALALWGLNLNSKNKSLQGQVNSLNNNPAIVEQRKTNELISKVSKLTDVPTGEQPQAALVSDANALKQQYPFFAPVQNGDQILFYFKSGKVIVYRPSTNKIVETGPLTVNQATAPATSTSSSSTSKTTKH